MLLRRVGASGKSGEKGAGNPFLILQYGSWGLGVALWGWLAPLAQGELGSGLQPGGREACRDRAARWCGAG